MKPETIYCFACNMNFRVENPHYKDADRTTCRDCGRAFWHAQCGHAPVKVGVWPEDVEFVDAEI